MGRDDVQSGLPFWAASPVTSAGDAGLGSSRRALHSTYTVTLRLLSGPFSPILNQPVCFVVAQLSSIFSSGLKFYYAYSKRSAKDKYLKASPSSAS